MHSCVHFMAFAAGLTCLACPGLAFAQSQPLQPIQPTPSAQPAPSKTQAARPEPGGSPLTAVIVTATPLGSDLFELAPAASLLDGDQLLLNKRGTLGDTLLELPGMSATGWGPAASRPVIRGLDGDRIRILQNGIAVNDASSVSFDHAVAVHPMLVDRVEVVRGQAAVLYGGNAVGGVVNVIDNRLPQYPVEGVSGRVEARAGGAEAERSTGAALSVGNGRLVLRADAQTGRTSNLRIPGPAVSSRLRALAASGERDVSAESLAADGTLPNSASRSEGGALGGTAFWGKGMAGLSYSEFQHDYGAVAEPTVSIGMENRRWEFQGEIRELPGLLSSLRFKHGRTDYQHMEREDGVVGTTFLSQGHESRLEARHVPIGPLNGSIGLHLGKTDFSALGAEAFVPSTVTKSRGLFAYEEWARDALKLSLGARIDNTVVESAGGGNVPTGQVTPRFGAPQSRRFNGASGAVGAVYTLSPNVVLAANASTTQRAPTPTELYANGPHAATGAYEVGNPGFDMERSRSMEIALRLRSGPHSGSIGVFHTRFQNFISAFRTGATRGADGEIAPVDAGDRTSVASGEELLPELAFRAVPAVFRGVEADGRFRLSERGGQWDLHLRADYTRAHDRNSGEPLPRQAPLRVGGGLSFARGAASARMDLLRSFAQDRVSPNELPTDAYTLLNASAIYRFDTALGRWEAFLRAYNLLNVEARNAVSFIKDLAPLGARSLMAGVQGSF